MQSGVEMDDAISGLASQVVRDIAARGLAPGDRYLTTDEAQQCFGVRKATINSVFRMLSERDVLVRKQRAGTFVGPGGGVSQPTGRLDKVLVLYRDEMPAYLTADEIMKGLWAHMPGVSVQFVLLRSRDDASYVRTLIDQAMQTREAVGFVPISCSRDVYEVLAASRLPTVVMGSVDPQYENRLPSVDVDTVQAGKVMAEHLLGKGYSRIHVLMMEYWRVGDNNFFESMRSSLSQADVSVTGLRVQSLPADAESIRRYVKSVVAAGELPDVFVAWIGKVGQDEWSPELVADELRAHGLDVPGDVAVTYHLDRNLEAGAFPQFPCTHRVADWQPALKEVANRLTAMHRGESIEVNHVRLPVAMYEPTA